MKVVETKLKDCVIIEPKVFGDERGFFSETYSRQGLIEHGIDLTFVQDNQSLSAQVGTLRGLHFQLPPFAQDKLVRVTRGAIYDVAVDIRRQSPTFGQWVGAVISADEWNQILVPIGFAHGFCTIEPDTEVLYKVTAPYAPASERGIAWDDADLAIDWPLQGGQPVLSGKDGKNPTLANSSDLF